MEEKVYVPLIRVDDVMPILSRIALFGGMDDIQLASIVDRLKKVHYEGGEMIYHRGDAPSFIYIIIKGEVKIVIDAKGVSLELVSFGVGDCFGESSVIGIQAHSASAVAASGTELIVMERRVLSELQEEDKDLFMLLVLNIARETARRLHRSDQALTEYILNHKS